MRFVLLGPTGAGKTSLINAITGANLGVGDGMESATQCVQEVRYGEDVYVDTPGIPDTRPRKGWEHLDKVLQLINNEVVVVLVVNTRDLREKTAGLMVLFDHLLRFAGGAAIAVSCSCPTPQLKEKTASAVDKLKDLGGDFLPPTSTNNLESLTKLKGRQIPFSAVRHCLPGPPTRSVLQSNVLSMNNDEPLFRQRSAELEDEIADLERRIGRTGQYHVGAMGGMAVGAALLGPLGALAAWGFGVGNMTDAARLEVRRSECHSELARLRSNGKGAKLWAGIATLLDEGAG